MILYHGSSVGNLKELKPFLSEHKKPYVYFSANPVVALLYAVRPVPKPFSWYPYGFDGDKVVYSEYYENAFYDTYNGKTGFLYACEELTNVSNPTNITCAYTCEEPVSVEQQIIIEDLYLKFMEYQSLGKFKIKGNNLISKNEMNMVTEDLKMMISEHNLYSVPNSKISLFIRKHFTELWNENEVLKC